MKLKIQTRILFWYVIAFIILITIYIAAILTMMSDSVLSNAQELIRSEAEETAQEIYIEDDGPYYTDEDETFRYTHDNVIFVILDGANLAFGTVPTSITTSVSLGLFDVRSIDDQTGTQWLVYDLPLNGSYNLRAFYSLSASTQTMQQLVWMMIIAAPFLILLATLGGFWIIKRSFRPIQAITSTAETIKDKQTYNLRVQFDDTNDEVAQLARMMNGMLDQMEHAIEREREFSANVSHELRTPLTVLRAQVEYLLTKTSDEVVLNDAHSMIQQLTLMERLVNQFLELSRVRHIQPRDIETLDLGQVVEAVVQGVTPLAEDKQLTLTCTKPPHDMPCRSSETALLRIFHNVLSNAIKYTKPTGRITVVVEAQTDHYLVQVSDTGIGMSAEELSKVYDPFYRADRARTQDEGLGMGLTLTKELVGLLGGRIDLTSQVNEGTTVRIQLPRERMTN